MLGSKSMLFIFIFFVSGRTRPTKTKEPFLERHGKRFVEEVRPFRWVCYSCTFFQLLFYDVIFHGEQMFKTIHTYTYLRKKIGQANQHWTVDLDLNFSLVVMVCHTGLKHILLYLYFTIICNTTHGLLLPRSLIYFLNWKIHEYHMSYE